MSRVAITDLVAGDTAESADVNATLSSWNTALGTGAVGANNIRPEGLDRRTLSAANAAIYSAGKGASPYYSSSGSSGAVASVGMWTVVTLGGVAMQIGPTAPVAATDRNLVTAALQLDADNNTLVTLTIQRSTDAVTWTNPTIDYSFRTKVTATPRCIGYLLAHYLESGATAYHFRVAFQTAGIGNVTFNNGTLYTEDFAK